MSRAKAAADRSSPQHVAFEMEGDVGAVKDYGNILVLLAGTFENSDQIDSVARVGWALIELSERIEEARINIWRTLSKSPNNAK